MNTATGCGTLKVNKKFNSDIQDILKILDPMFAEVSYSLNEKDESAFDIDFIIDPEISYDSRDYEAVFNKVAKYIENGEVSFTLDNDYKGKYVFENGKWRELEGRIVYMDKDEETELVAQIVDIFYDYIEKKIEDPNGFTYPMTPDEDSNIREQLTSMMKNWEVFL
jgi:hypothetical protein